MEFAGARDAIGQSSAVDDDNHQVYHEHGEANLSPQARAERPYPVICDVLSPWGVQNSNAGVIFGAVSPLGGPRGRRQDVLGGLRGALG